MDDLSEVNKLFVEIDHAKISLGKRARLSDVDEQIKLVEADLIALRRMLVQYQNPSAIVEQSGQQLGALVRERLTQLDRLRTYKEEVEQISDEENQNDADAVSS